jgi:hypothetical protein
MTTTKLTTGRQYDLGSLRLVDWTDGDGTGHEGYTLADYFDGDGKYLGPDGCGIEPIVEIATHTWTVRTDADMTEIVAADIDSAAVAWADGKCIAEIDGIESLVRHIESIDGAWLWIESDAAPDGDRVYAGRENMA